MIKVTPQGANQYFATCQACNHSQVVDMDGYDIIHDNQEQDVLDALGLDELPDTVFTVSQFCENSDRPEYDRAVAEHIAGYGAYYHNIGLESSMF